MPQTVWMTRGSDGSSSTFSRSFLMNTVMLDVSPTNSLPQAASTSCSFDSTRPGLEASAKNILNSLGVSDRRSPSFVTRNCPRSSTKRPACRMSPRGATGAAAMLARRRWASMCMSSSRGSNGFTM